MRDNGGAHGATPVKPWRITKTYLRRSEVVYELVHIVRYTCHSSLIPIILVGIVALAGDRASQRPHLPNVAHFNVNNMGMVDFH